MDCVNFRLTCIMPFNLKIKSSTKITFNLLKTVWGGGGPQFQINIGRYSTLKM